MSRAVSLLPPEPLEPCSEWLPCAHCGLEVAQAVTPGGQRAWIGRDGLPHHWPNWCGSGEGARRRILAARGEAWH